MVRQRLKPTLIFLAVACVLGFSHASSFRSLVEQWNKDPNYSYGFFVPPLALAIAWSRRSLIDPARVGANLWGLLLLAALLLVRVPLFEWNEQYIETATLPLVVGALVFTIGGGHLFRVLLPAILFLGFMLPPPPSFNALLARPLQGVATDGSVAVLRLIGIPVIAEGNVIVTSETPLEVARACNGLSMLLSFVTLVVATVLLIPRPWPERIVLLLSAVPIAVLTNILRITITAAAYRTLGAEVAEAYAHDYAGYAMMPIALALVWLELKICSKLFVEVETIEPAAMIRRRAGLS